LGQILLLPLLVNHFIEAIIMQKSARISIVDNV